MQTLILPLVHQSYFSYKPRDLLLQSYDLLLFAVVSFESLIKFGVILRNQFLLVSYFITL